MFWCFEEKMADFENYV
ncbi:hypothetical protein LINPERHAP1_LOCUS13011 [Linum perenne]